MSQGLAGNAGVLPADSEIRQLLALIRIQVLDVDDGGADENMAKDRLRSAVLHDPGQANTAWALLITACARLTAARSGTERPGLQRVLLDGDIDLQAPHSYRDDIEQLKPIPRQLSTALRTLLEFRSVPPR